MPYNDPDPTDPNMLVGVVLPADAEATREMAYVFAEEFARLGHSREQLLWLFKNPFYGGAHGAYRTLGQREILSIIDECLNVWANMKVSVQDVQSNEAFQPETQKRIDVMPSDSDASQTESEILRLSLQDNVRKEFNAGEDVKSDFRGPVTSGTTRTEPGLDPGD